MDPKGIGATPLPPKAVHLGKDPVPDPTHATGPKTTKGRIFVRGNPTEAIPAQEGDAPRPRGTAQGASSSFQQGNKKSYPLYGRIA